MQRRKRYVKLKWCNQHFFDHEVTVKLYNRHSIHAFTWFEEEDHVGRLQCHCTLTDLTQEKLYTIGYFLYLLIMSFKT